MKQGRPDDISRRHAIRALLGASLAVSTLGGAGALQAMQLGIVHEQIALGGLRSPLRVAFLTDLHYGLYVFSNRVRTWVKAANAAQPDLILLGGDLMDVEAETDFVPLLTELARLRAPLGVLGVWGNHDYGSFGRYKYGFFGHGPGQPNWQQQREFFTEALARSGITMLLNAGRAVREDLWIGGVDDLIWGKPDVAAALGAANGRATLLLSHNPDVLPNLPQPVGLVLCGHTHGGQIRLPLIGAPFVPSEYGQKYAMGWVQGAHSTPAYVSRGLGTTGIPLRNLCMPELTVFTLTPRR